MTAEAQGSQPPGEAPVEAPGEARNEAPGEAQARALIYICFAISDSLRCVLRGLIKAGTEVAIFQLFYHILSFLTAFCRYRDILSLL